MAWTTPERIPNIAEVNDPDRVYNTHIIDNLSYLKDYSAQSLASSSTLTTIVSASTAETSIISYAISNANIGDIYEYVIYGDFLQNSGGTADLVFKANIGSTTVITNTVSALASNAVRRNYEMRGALFVTSLTTQTVCNSYSQIAGSTAGLVTATSSALHGYVANSATEDMSTSKTFAISVAIASATNTDLRLAAYSVNRIRKLS